MGKKKLPKCDGRPQLWAHSFGADNLWISYPNGQVEYYDEYGMLDGVTGWVLSGFSDDIQEASIEELTRYGFQFIGYL